MGAQKYLCHRATLHGTNDPEYGTGPGNASDNEPPGKQ